MAQDRKALLAVILAVKRGFVSPEDGMALLEQAEAEADAPGAATIYDQIPESQVEELREEASVLAADTAQAELVLEEAGVPREVQQTLLSIGTEAPPDKSEVEATLLSLSPTRATTIIERPKLKTEKNERYKVLREHARGGMGRILVAVDNVVGREVALKELLPFRAGSGSAPPRAGSGKGTPTSDTSAAAARFLREATVTGQLEHPNIVPVYEIGQRDDGSLYYTMKFVKGRTLASRLRMIRNDTDLDDEGRQAERLKLLDAYVAVCNAIAFAHSRGVIHRDLKPANIMLGDFGEALVLDWGLARVKGGEEAAFSSSINQDSAPDLTLEGEVMGTPAYMPPEQAAGKLDQVDERSDVYSLGAVLFEMVTGEAPYIGKTAKAVLSSVLSEPPRRVDDLSPDAPPELAALCERALAREPQDRFQTARELAEEVQAFRDGRMVSVYKYSAMELARRFVAKNRGSVAVAVLALIVLLAGGVYGYINVTRERDNALAAESDAQIQRTLAETQAIEAEKQKRIAESQAAEAEKQKGIAEDEAREAEHQRGIAKEQAELAEQQKRAALKSAEDARFERARANEKAAEAASKAELAKLKEEDAKRALAMAQRNLANAHVGYATLAQERGQDGAHILHLAAAHAADGSVVPGSRVVAALTEAAFPIWRTRSYIDLPAGAACFSADRRVCAAPIHRPPKLLEEFDAIAGKTNLPDIGIWDVATGTLLRRISTSIESERRLLLTDDGTRLIALETGGTLRIWDVGSGEELLSRAVQSWTFRPQLVAGGPGKFITAGADGVVREWNAADGAAGAVREWKNTVICALAASADGTRVAAASATGEVMVWDLTSDALPQSLKRLDEITHLRFTSAGLLVGGPSGIIELWELAGPSVVRTYKSAGEFGYGAISALEVSPDGTLLGVGRFEKGWRLMNLETALSVSVGTGGNVQGLAFSPEGSSLVLALKGEGFNVLHLDGRPLKTQSIEHSLGSMALCISPDGESYASGDYGGNLLKRRVADGTTLWSCKVSTYNLEKVVFSPDGATVAVYSSDGKIHFVDAQTGVAKDRALRLVAFSYTLKYTPDGRYFCAPAPEGTADGAVHLVDPATATLARTIRLGAGIRVLGVVFDPMRDRAWLIDSYLRQWAWDYDDPKTNRTAVMQGQLTMPRATIVYGTELSPDGKAAAISFNDGTVIGWQPEPFQQLYSLRVGEGPIINCAFGQGSSYFACGTADGLLCFVNSRTGVVARRQRANRAAILATAVSTDGRDIITSGVDGEFLAWEAPQIMAPETYQIGLASTTNVVVAADGILAAAAVDTGTVRLFRVNDGQVLGDRDVAPNWVTGLAFSPDSARLAISLSSGKVIVWSMGKDVPDIEFAAHDYIAGIAFDAEGRLIVGGSYYGLQVRDAADGKLQSRLPVAEAVGQVVPFPADRRVLVAAYGVEGRIVDTDTGAELARIERSAYYTVLNAISPDGKRLASARDKGLIGIYETATGKRLQTLRVRDNDLVGLQFAPDNERLFYLTSNAGAALIDVASGQEVCGTWLPYAYTARGVLAADGSFALIASGGPNIECWRLRGVLDKFEKLSSLDLRMLVALTQYQTDLRLDGLRTDPLPRGTGQATWLTEDSQPPAFLRGGLPDWSPRLSAEDIAFAVDFLAADQQKRLMRLEHTGREWVNSFEGFRYKEVVNGDLSIERVPVPRRKRDLMGNFIGEPQGLVDFLGWFTQRRMQSLLLRSDKISLWVTRGDEAAAKGQWRAAQGSYNVARTLAPERMDVMIAYAHASYRLGEPWTISWTYEGFLPQIQPALKGRFHLVGALLLASGWDKQAMLDRFDTAVKEGYTNEDIHLHRAEALELWGSYSQAVGSAEVGLAKVSDPTLRAQLTEIRNRCLVWAKLQAKETHLPGAVVTDVQPGSAAERAGLRTGDMIVKLEVEGEERLATELDSAWAVQYHWDFFLNTCSEERRQATLTVRREGRELRVIHERVPFDAGLFSLKEDRG